jgi:pseudouridine-5'-phosphate glycosidase
MIILGDHVKSAIKHNLPLVALETTIISHGMPYPLNIQVAKNVEKVIRDNGAVPVTIGIVDGDFIVGLNERQLEEFGKRKDIVKCSLRDLSFASTRKMWGSTTVSASIFIARAAGIDVFVTGGIGGVHRHVDETLDISTDLDALANIKTITISAGPKAILDVPKTLEYLETKGVTVASFNSDSIPLFYTATSNYKAPYNVTSPKEIAQVYLKSNELGLKNSLLIFNPIPAEDSIPEEEINQYIDIALRDADKEGITGKDITPYLLKRLNELTEGKSQAANTSLIYNNARLGALVAKELQRMKNEN